MTDSIVLIADDQLDFIAGGPWPLVVRAVAWAVGTGAVASAANDVVELGEKLHDAVCPH